MNELHAALILVGLVVAGFVASLFQDRGRRAAVFLAERPLTWIAPVVSAVFLSWVVHRLMLILGVRADLQIAESVRRHLVNGALGLVESVIPLAILAGQLGWVRQALDDKEISPGAFWGGLRANFPPLLLLAVLLAMLGMLLEVLTPMLSRTWSTSGFAVAGLVVLYANVEIFPLAAFLGAGPTLPADMFQRVEAMPRSAKWDAAMPVAIQMLVLGIVTLYPIRAPLAPDSVETRLDLAFDLHAASVFDYGLHAHWFGDLTREIAPYSISREFFRIVLGCLVGCFSVFMIAMHMLLKPAGAPAPAPALKAPLPALEPSSAAPTPITAPAPSALPEATPYKRRKRRKKR